jgi:hypothetical protein
MVIPPEPHKHRTGYKLDGKLLAFLKGLQITNSFFDRKKVRYPGFGGQESGGCFAAGTLVWTSNGQKPIETLQENDAVLTRVMPLQYGYCSDEKVQRVINDGEITLIGFNDDTPFFTNNHVFFTTTGLRAISPEAARQENPWLQVGELKVGHILLKTIDGTSHERVIIEKITTARVSCNFVYGVHLREGLRSYHANGYLVHLDYPEITIRNIAKVIRGLPT